MSDVFGIDQGPLRAYLFGYGHAGYAGTPAYIQSGHELLGYLAGRSRYVRYVEAHPDEYCRGWLDAVRLRTPATWEDAPGEAVELYRQGYDQGKHDLDSAGRAYE